MAAVPVDDARLLFLLMTLGPALLALAWFESPNLSLGARAHRPHSISSSIRNFFVTLGRVPLFFYLLQWPTAHFIAVFVHFASGKPWRWMFGSLIGVKGPPPGAGFNLPVVYVCWIAGVLLLYPLWQMVCERESAPARLVAVVSIDAWPN